MPANKNRSKTITTISASDKRVHVWWLIAAIHLPASSLFPSAPCTVLTTIAMQQAPAYQAYYHGTQISYTRCSILPGRYHTKHYQQHGCYMKIANGRPLALYGTAQQG